MSAIGLDVETSRVQAVRFGRSWRATAMADETTLVTHGEAAGPNRTWTRSGQRRRAPVTRTTPSS